jgi:exonuclease 3'-5' domain-containing protein 1
VDRVFLDCEGVNLGSEGGTLSIISLGVMIKKKPNEPKTLVVFLIDVPALRGRRNRNIKRIIAFLESKAAWKIMFDGRMDASEFFHGFGAELEGVIDLQVADILSRTKRREGIEQQLERFISFVPKWDIKNNRSLYSRLTKLNGLDAALREHGIDVAPKPSMLIILRISHNSDVIWTEIDHNKWLDRPLDLVYIQYAVEDIQKIHLLYEAFVENRCIPAPGLEQKSALYIEQHYAGRPEETNPYKSHGLLPLGIFHTASVEGSIQCPGCERELPSKCFMTGGKKKKKHFSEMCLVCQAVECHERHMKRWTQNKAAKGEGSGSGTVAPVVGSSSS